MKRRYLVTYLQDHLAGSEAGLRRFESAAKKNEGTPLGEFLTRCVGDLKEERKVLRSALKAVGGHPPVIKQPLAFVGEKLARLKLNGHLTSYSPLSRLEDLEGLSLGVQGKLRLWRVLHELSKNEPSLGFANFASLYRLAEQQAEELERFRMMAALRAFKGGEERSLLHEPTGEAAIAR